VLNLLNDLQKTKDTAYLFISHDLRVVRYMADRIGVLYRGRLVETGSSDQIFAGPNHPYTQMLLAASSNEGRTMAQAAIDAGPDAGLDASFAGCAFAGRCPLAEDACRKAEPVAREVEAGHVIACWKGAG
ncbi:MAG: ABC transporter ATP-binding protein, partial [Mesorhizobium sp.]|uniref:oligopeptide/dipeptide ABC transporter ATP-binding protein n=1 Tax=Mesorhizobium sp. TaxID=1871066 RepID=UPI001222F67E